MSSIAYVTDKHMIEFHRLNGNRSINFWRPSSSKRFTDFHPGDLLFFLAKGTERGPLKEKGLIGYGRFEQAFSMSFKQMWKHFGTLNGYPTEKALKEAILKVSKEKSLAHAFSCLKLSDIVFFQSPVYLSEVGIPLSANLESYLYLDKDDLQATAKILSAAQTVGIDSWMSVANDLAPSDQVFTEDLIRHKLTLKIAQLPDVNGPEDRRKAHKLLVQYEKSHPHLHWLDDRQNDLFGFQDKRLILISALSSSKTLLPAKLMGFIGKAAMITAEAQFIDEFKGYALTCQLIIDQPLNEPWLSLLANQGIQLIDPLPAEPSTDSD